MNLSETKLKRYEIISDWKEWREGEQGYLLFDIPFFKLALSPHVKINMLKTDPKFLFHDQAMDSIFSDDYIFSNKPDYIVEVEYLPGVTDNPGKSAQEALFFIGGEGNISSGRLILLKGKDKKYFRKEDFGNPLIEKIQIYSREDFQKKDRFSIINLPIVQIQHGLQNEEIPLDGSDEELEELSKKKLLALNLKELKCLKDYFLDLKVKEDRQYWGLPHWPTRLELEVFAQTWSEHCKHKIFSASIDYREEGHKYNSISNQKIESLYKSFIQKATQDIKENRGIDWLKSVFSDNAGIVRFDDVLDICIKVETHNSPSALDPYGGALTGILGVNRDILGCGIGAKPIANMDVFCVGNNELIDSEGPYLPKGLMHPKGILKGIHRGVQDGGNKSGIPNINGAILFDRDYSGKPLVFCGTVGVIPHVVKSGRESFEKAAEPGHLVVVIGGAVGADGIHGATFSSLELDESAPATAVQIGDPITQKRCSDFLLEARDKGLYSCVTDNGAGGLSSSVGEMAILTDGARIDLKNVN